MIEIQQEYKKIHKLAGLYVFYYKNVASGIFKPGSFADKDDRSLMNKYGDELQSELASRRIKLADIPVGISKHVDFLKSSVEKQAIEINKLRDNFINKKV